MLKSSNYQNLRLSKKRRFPFLTHHPWTFLGIVLSFALLLLPILALTILAISGTSDSFSHIAQYVLPRSSWITLLLLVGVGILSAIFGTVTAWLVTFFDFPGRNMFIWLLVLPLAIPSYIAAYFFSEFLSYSGPLQEFIRHVGGYQSIKDYWSPDAHSLGGAIVVLASVFYPYTYLSVMGLYRIQGGQYVAAARTLQSTPGEIFLRILLPLAWPAIAIGMLLAMMECLNDIGAVEYLGIETLTLSVFSVWLNRSDIPGAAQLALVLFAIVLLLVFLETRARRNRIFTKNAKACSLTVISRQRMSKKRWKFAAILVCIIPLLPGLLPTLILLFDYSLARTSLFFDPKLWQAASTSIILGIASAIATISIALFLAFLIRFFRQPAIHVGVHFSSLGYAIPGTIIALGLFTPIASFDNWLDSIMRSQFDLSTGLLISGSSGILVYAYVIRFMAIARGNISSGFEKISQNIDHSARTLGSSRYGVMAKINIPQLMPAIAVAGLLVFIDTIKELSATLFLRPFNTETLSTYIYDRASRGLIEETGFASLIIVVVGILPVMIVMRRMTEQQIEK